jgi:thiol:disulfide interchange protein DsbD
LKIPTRSATVAHAKTFEDALSHLPQEPASVHARAVIERRALKVEVDGLPTAWRGRQLRLFVELPGVVEHAAAIEQRWDAERWVARVPLSSQRSESPTTMHAVLVPAGQATGVRTLLTITGSWATASSPFAAHATVIGSTDNAADPEPSSIKE